LLAELALQLSQSGAVVVNAHHMPALTGQGACAGGAHAATCTRQNGAGMADGRCVVGVQVWCVHLRLFYGLRATQPIPAVLDQPALQVLAVFGNVVQQLPVELIFHWGVFCEGNDTC
jgi:hypothetical protein